MSSFWRPVCNYKHIIKTFVSPGKDLFLGIYRFLLFMLSFGSKKRMSFFSSLPRAYLKIHSHGLYALLCVILKLYWFAQFSRCTHFGSPIWHKSPANCDAHLGESNFQTRPSGKRRLRQKIAGEEISFPLPNGKQKASMAVEASIALPIFLFFLMNILFSFDMLRLHGNLAAAMHQTGNRMAFYGYAYKAVSGEGPIITEGIDSLVLSVGYARNQVIGILGKEYLNKSSLSSGVSGLQFVKSSVMEEGDIIDLVASYKVKPFIKVIGFPDFAMENRYYGRAWTGYDVESRQSDMSAEDPIVYVAEYGSVYHVARNCSYLAPSVEAVPNGTVTELRNANGEKYYNCERCRSNKYQAVVYITSQGNKVHGSLECSGLKRTVYLIHLSEAGGKGMCTKCGG